MGYGKYWNFERVMAKAQALISQKGYHLGEHFVEITEMAELEWYCQRGYEPTSFSCRLYGCGHECRSKERDGEGGTAIFQSYYDTGRRCEKHGVLNPDVQRWTREGTSSSSFRYQYFLAFAAENGRAVWGDGSYN